MAFAEHWEDASAEQRRDDARRTLRLEAEGVTGDGERAEVLVHNLSEGGLLIETGAALNVGEEIDIELPHVGTTPATARWQSGRLFGCEFMAPLPAAALSAAQLRSVPAGVAAVTTNALPDAGFPQRLQRLRKARGLTLAQVADALGVSKPTVWAWEQGRSRGAGRRSLGTVSRERHTRWARPADRAGPRGSRRRRRHRARPGADHG
jgi:DNA-binding transcriptional regulator YiaG